MERGRCMVEGRSVRGGIYASALGIFGMVFDFLLFWAVTSLRLPPGQAHVISFMPAAFPISIMLGLPSEGGSFAFRLRRSAWRFSP